MSRWLAFFCMLLPSIGTASERMPISVLVYHNKPPYIIDVVAEQGLYFDFIRFLNLNGSVYQFSLRILPRNRVQQQLNKGQFNGLILGVNPLWFDDVAQTKYLWTDAVFRDEDIFVSLVQSPFEYRDSVSLQGRKVCVVLGNFYSGISNADQSLDLSLLHASKEISIFNLLKKGRCDLGVVSRSNYNYLLKNKRIDDSYYLSEKVHDRFDRKLLIAKSQMPIYIFIEQALEDWLLVDTH